jgi:hypothetical protein
MAIFLTTGRGGEEAMLTCSCGGMFMVIDIEKYPAGLSGLAKLDYPRTCTVKCNKCGTIKEKQPYD